MKYDPGSMPLPGADPAHAVAHVDPIGATGAAYRTMGDRKDHGFALRERHDLRTRLHARPLLGEHEVSAGEVGIRPRQQKRDLQRKDVLAVEILMQAVVVALAVLQQKGCRPGLSGMVTAIEKFLVVMPI